MKHNKASILYIEDNKATRELFSETILPFCSNLYIAKTIKEGLKLYKLHKIDIVISALKMKKTTGIDLLNAIKDINKNQIVIFTILHEDTGLLLKAIELGADAYISKPINTQNIKRIITKSIHQIEYKESFYRLKENEEKFRQIAQISQMGIFIYKKTFVYVNDAFCKMIGYSKTELYNMRAWDVVKEEDKREIKNISLRRLEGEHFPKEYHDLDLVTKNGEIKTSRISTDTIKYDDSYAGLGTVVDITDIKKMKERLNLLAQAIEQMDEMVRITDKNANIIYVNKAISKYTKYTKEELIGKSNSIFKSNQHTIKFYEKMWTTILSNKPYQGIFINLKKDGEVYYEDQTITPITDENNNIKYFVSTSKDVTQRIKMEKKLKLLAITDGLTGIYNRYKINTQIEDEFKRISRYGGSFALIMFDIDFFKKVNDQYGHDVGDLVLITLSKIVLESIRDTDKFGRWGGEEFMILAPELNKEDAINFAEKLRKEVEAYDFKDVGRVTISLGVVTSKGETSKEAMLKDVDNALYEAKNSGRNRVAYI